MNIKNKDFLYPLLLGFVFAVLFSINYFYFGDMIYDCGREFLVPEAINNGNVLIKDIFISYFPLSYQINAFLFKIFGTNLDTLRVFGVITALFDVILYYFISRFFTNEKNSVLISAIIGLFTMFNVSYLFNYVMGYSFACILAVPCFLIGALSALNYLESDKAKFLYLSALFYGVCFGLKAEFVFLIIPVICLLIYKKESLKNQALSIVLFLIPVVLSFGILFISGFSFDDLKNYIQFLYNFLDSEILAQYTYTVTRKDPVKWLQLASFGFIQSAVLFIISYLVLYFPLKFNKKPLFWVLTSILFICFAIYAIFRGSFVGISFFTYLSILNLILIYFILKSDKKELVFLVLTGFCLVIRHNFIYTSNHSAYTFGIAFLACIIALLTVIKNETFKKVFMTFLILTGLINTLYFTFYNRAFGKYEIKTGKGIFKTAEKNEADIINKTLEFMKDKEDKTILILPEGGMLNFLADKKTNLKYHQLLPNHIETLGENNIIDNLKENKPDYILFNTASYAIYGTPKICKDFGQNICGFVLSNYNQIKEFSNEGDLSVFVYEIK